MLDKLNWGDTKIELAARFIEAILKNPNFEVMDMYASDKDSVAKRISMFAYMLACEIEVEQRIRRSFR